MTPILQSGGNIQDYLPYNASARSIKWRVAESILQSAAIYSITSISLAVTSFVSPTIAFPACHSVFPSVIVRRFLSSSRRQRFTNRRSSWLFSHRESYSC